MNVVLKKHHVVQHELVKWERVKLDEKLGQEVGPNERESTSC